MVMIVIRRAEAGVVFTEDVAKIAGQQGRYAAGRFMTRILAPNEKS
jgi:hypothetical protein